MNAASSGSMNEIPIGIDAAQVRVSPARSIDPLRDRPYAQKVIWSRPQQLNSGLFGQPIVKIMYESTGC